MELGFINLGTWEIVGIIAVGVLLFGSRLPTIARSLGKSVTEFKAGIKDIKSDVEHDEPRKLEKTESREIPSEKVEKEEPEKVSN